MRSRKAVENVGSISLAEADILGCFVLNSGIEEDIVPDLVVGVFYVVIEFVTLEDRDSIVVKGVLRYFCSVCSSIEEDSSRISCKIVIVDLDICYDISKDVISNEHSVEIVFYVTIDNDIIVCFLKIIYGNSGAGS